MGISWKFLISIMHGGWDITVLKDNCDNFVTRLYEKMTTLVFSYQFHINIASKNADASTIFLAMCLNLIFDRKVTLKCQKPFKNQVYCYFLTLNFLLKIGLRLLWQKMWVISDLWTLIQLADVSSLKNLKIYCSVTLRKL